MFSNYLKTAFRQLVRNRTNTFINVIGLGVALASVAVIAGYISHERSFDNFHPNADAIYQVTYQEVATPAMRHVPAVSPPTAPTMVDELPEIEAGLRLRIGSRHLMSVDDTRFFEEGIVYADSTFFEFFGFHLLSGNPGSVLSDPGSIVLNEAMAHKYFGNSNPIGRIVTIDDEQTYTVTGVVQNAPTNTHLRFDFLLAFDAFRVPSGYPTTLSDWQWISFPTFVRLAPGANAANLDAKLQTFMARHFPPRSAEVARLRIQPIRDVYLHGPVDTAFVQGNRAYLNGLAGIAALILLLSIFNFTNLSAVQALRRGREVSVRKVLGATPAQIRRQYIGETMVTAVVGLSFAALLLTVSRWLFPDFVHAEHAVSLLVDPRLSILVFLSIPILGILAGFYPSMLLSGLDISNALKARSGGRGRGSVVRNTLVVVQFAIAAGLVITSLVVSKQLAFISTTDLGFERESVIAVQVEGERLRMQWPALRDALLADSRVVNATMSGHLMDGHQGSVPMEPEGASEENVRAMNLYGVGYRFAETMGLAVLEGRTHDSAVPTDSSEGVVLNRSAARYFEATTPGWEEPIGKWLRVSEIMEGSVIGVVEDFHFTSLHSSIEPLVMIIPSADMDNILIRVAPGNVAETLAGLGTVWNRVAPDLPFNYQFLDDHLAELYGRETTFRGLVVTFTTLALLIACLGLLGLVSFICTVRTHEMAVRKVLGSRTDQLVTLILRPFGLHILLANLVAWPSAWYLLNQWLDGFAYRIDIGFGVFFICGIGTLTIAFVTVAARTIQTALVNPTESLTSE